jgi:general secretion pathway protein G
LIQKISQDYHGMKTLDCYRHQDDKRSPDDKNHRKISGQNGFSFLELMVVVVILGILATYIAPRFMGRTDDAKSVKARVDIAAIETSLKLYKLDNGGYPTTDQGILALIEKPSTDPIPLNWKEKGYLAKARVPKDPWGREYLYLSPGIHDDYDIISYGADGEPGGEGKNKDISSWELE